MSGVSSPIRSILPYFGGKRTLAPRIVAEFGPHVAYCEGCAGSAAVMLAKNEASMEIANDLYGSVVNLGRVLSSSRWVELRDRCSRILMHEGLFLECKQRVRETEHVVAPSMDDIGDEHVDAAVAFFVRSWMGRNGNAGTTEGNATMARRFTSNGGSGGLRWHQAVESIEGWHNRLMRVQWMQMPVVDLVERLDDTKDWVLYLDPPYLKKGAKYVCDFAAEDHARLAEAANAKKRCRVLVSYYDDPMLDDLYPPDRWTKLSLPMNKGLVNAGARKSGEVVIAPEVLLINGDSLTQGGLFS